MTNQNEFLGNIRAALGEQVSIPRPRSLFEALFARPRPAEALTRISTRSSEDQLLLVERFCDNARELHLDTHRVHSFDQAAAVMVELIRSKQPEFHHTKHVVVHDHPDLAALGLWKRFNREAVTLHTTFAADGQIKDKTLASFIGITAPQIGVAESATLVEVTAPGRPRSTSLLPSIHIALVRAELLVADLAEAYALLQESVSLDQLVLISGPSKTADIEAQLVHGAHGPREVHVLLLIPAEQGGKATLTDEGAIPSP